MSLRKSAGKKLLEIKEPGDPFGFHRVLDPHPTLPQSAQKLDASLPIYSNEILISVECLNIDAASFLQMDKSTSGDVSKIKDIILENCRMRGKQHNVVTGSGGMLIGTVLQVGSRYQGNHVKPGDKVATLVSLTLTPLQLTRIQSINLTTHQVLAEGHAIIFESGVLAKMPSDIDDKVALAAFDVCGAPLMIYRAVKPGNRVVVVGAGGKAGILSCFAARKKLQRRGKLIGIEPNPVAAKELRELKVCDEVLEVDATNPSLMYQALLGKKGAKRADVIMNVASVPGTEAGCLLTVSPKGTILFFSMATSFTLVSLASEGIGCTAKLEFGNGFVPGHSAFILKLIRDNANLLAVLNRRYGCLTKS